MKRVREVSRVGPGTDDEDPEPVDWGKSTGEVGRLGRLRPVEGRHLPGVLDWDREEDLGSCLRERGAQAGPDDQERSALCEHLHPAEDGS